MYTAIARIAIVGTILAATPVGAQPASDAAYLRNDESRAATFASIPAPVRFVTRHRVTIGGLRVGFTATAGETHLRDDAGEVAASIFSYAYVADRTDPRTRPVLFVVGGGPGSASHALNVGLLGPWALIRGRLALAAATMPPVTPPYEVVDNANSVLDVADLVFIDPVGTGYSRALGRGRAEDFWGSDEDLESIAQFMQLWLSKNGRWSSPKFFAGESYGGTRAARLPNLLLGGPTYPGVNRAIALDGVIVLVNSLAWPLAATGLEPPLIGAFDLPTQAVTAWYHGAVDRRGRSLEAVHADAEAFTRTRYADAVRKEAAGTLSRDERDAVVRELVAYTGLPEASYAGRLTMPAQEFARRLLAERGLAVSVYDSRYTFPAAPNGADPVADDALLARSTPVLTSAFLAVEHDRLKVAMDRPFAPIYWRDLLAKWKFPRRASWASVPAGPGAMPPPRTFETNAHELAVAMNRNDRMRVLVATGYFDLQMTPAATRFVVEQAGLPTERVTLRSFVAGHEPYVDDAAAVVAEDIRRLIRGSR